MNCYKLTIAYDGTDYFGWQEQKDKPSISQVLIKAFDFVFERDVLLLGASRTDAGVHAMGQVARCKTNLAIDSQTLRWAWNNVLPADIMIRSLKLVNPSFHPYYNVQQKIYYYHFFLDRPLPFVQRYGWYYPYKINFDILHKALQFFTGIHDFRAFRSAEDFRNESVRTIDSITLTYFKRYNIYRITTRGQKFMRHMIRRIVGASLAVAAKQNGSVDMIKEIMEARDPNHPLPNAPAKGLLLYNIRYDDKGNT